MGGAYLKGVYPVKTSRRESDLLQKNKKNKNKKRQKYNKFKHKFENGVNEYE